MVDISQHTWKCAWMTTSLRPTERTQQQHLQNKTALLSCPTHNILPDFTFRHVEFPPGMESPPISPGKQLLQGRGIHTSRHEKDVNLPREPIPAKKRGIYGYRYIHIREHYSEQVSCTQHTHTSGYRARESSTELPATEDGKFQHGGHFHASTPMLRQPHRWKLPERDPEQTQSKMEKAQQSHPVE